MTTSNNIILAALATFGGIMNQKSNSRPNVHHKKAKCSLQEGPKCSLQEGQMFTARRPNVHHKKAKCSLQEMTARDDCKR